MSFESKDREKTIWVARYSLLIAIRDVKPEVLIDLLTLLPLFRAATHYFYIRHRYAPDLWYWDFSESKHTDPSVLSLREAVGDWADKHNLRFDWLIERAFHTLASWDRNEKFFELMGWDFGGVGYVVPVNEDEASLPPFDLEDGWRPDVEVESAFLQRARKAFDDHLKSYTQRIKTILKERNQVEAKRKYSPLHEGFDDFTLLALKLVCELTYEQLKEKLETEANCAVELGAIKKRVKRTAKLCGIDSALR